MGAVPSLLIGWQWLGSAVPSALAGAVAPCALVPGGCDQSVNPLDPATSPLPAAIIDLFVYSAAGLCSLFVIWGGIQMLTSFGDDSKIQQGRNTVMGAIAGLAVALTAQTVVAFVAARATFTGSGINPILHFMKILVDSALSLFWVVFVIIMIAAGFRLVIARGKTEEMDAVRRILTWSIIGAIVILVARVATSTVLFVGF